MFMKKLILKHGVDIVVALVLISYIIMDVKVPAMLSKTSESIIGLVVLSALALLSFGYLHPIVGILAVIIIFKMIVDNRDEQPGSQLYKEPMYDDDDTFTSQMPSTSVPDEIRSNDDTLEEEVIANMAPLISSSNYMSNSDQIAPVMAPSGGSSLA